MSQIPHPFNSFHQPPAAAYDQPDQAVARFFNSVFAWMFAGLAVTTVVALLAASRPQIILGLGNGVWVLFIVELLLVGVISAATNRISAGVATGLFLLYAAINGVVLSALFLVYTHAALASAFAVAAGMFGVMSVYGYVTRRDLTALGSLMMMGLIGVVIASVVSLFWHNSALAVLINYVGVIVFVGLTAYDTQRLKQVAYATSGNAAMASRLSVNGALTLYLDFLNLFLFLLRIMSGNDRR